MTLVRWVRFYVFFCPLRLFVESVVPSLTTRSSGIDPIGFGLPTYQSVWHHRLLHRTTVSPTPLDLGPVFVVLYLSFHCHSLVPSSFTSLPHLLLQIALPHSSYPKFPAPAAQRESVKTGCFRLSRLSPPPHPSCLTLTIAFQLLCPPPPPSPPPP